MLSFFTPTLALQLHWREAPWPAPIAAAPQKLHEELHGLKRIEIDVEYEDGANLTQRIKLEAR